jgi:F-type H+-transporting ATPase subunit a
MEKLEHELWIVQAVNGALGSLVAAALRALGRPVPAHGDVIPDYLVMSGLVVVAWTIVCALVGRNLSVDNPSRLQIFFEDSISAAQSMLHDYVGHKGPRYLAIVSTMAVFILTGNLMGLVPGLKSPTSNINVTLGCALTVAVYYHIQGVKEQGLGAYLKHFAAPPGAPLFIAPIMLPIEIISHLSRVLSLSLRLFGNIFAGGVMVAVIGLFPSFLLWAPTALWKAFDMFIGLIQAFIFAFLSILYFSFAVSEEH